MNSSGVHPGPLGRGRALPESACPLSGLERRAPTRRPCSGVSVSPRVPGVPVIAAEGGRLLPLTAVPQRGKARGCGGRTAVRGVQECSLHPDGEPIAPPGPPRQRVRAARWGPGPRAPGTGAAHGPPPAPAHEEGPRRPRCPLTRPPPAAAADPAPAAPPHSASRGLGSRGAAPRRG